MQENASFFKQGDMGELACALYEDILTAEERNRLKEKIHELN
jgi:hypothetical protein